MKTLGLLFVGLAACGGDDGGGVGATAMSSVTGFMGGTVTGTGMFVQGAPDTAANSVTLTLTLNGCATGKVYPAHIHTGSACTDTMTQGGHWDMTRGEGIPMITCAGTTGMVTYTRTATDPTLAWSVGGDATTNVIGHIIVVHDPDAPMLRIGCGPITAAN